VNVSCSYENNHSTADYGIICTIILSASVITQLHSVGRQPYSDQRLATLYGQVYCMWNLFVSRWPRTCAFGISLYKPGTERAQALSDISRSALCRHSNETRSPIANRPNGAELEATPYHSAKLHPGPCSSTGMRRGKDRQTDRHRDARDQYTFSPRLHLTRNVTIHRVTP